MTWGVWSKFGQLPYHRLQERIQVSGRTGFVHRTFFRDQKSSFRYLTFVPHSEAPPDGYPAILFLNGLGNNGEDGFRQLSNCFGRPVWEMSEAFPFLVIAPQCPPNSSWSGDADQLAIDILDETIANFPIDSSRLVLTGVSAGGAGTLHLATKYANRFSSVVPISTTGGNVETFSETMAMEQTPTWIFFNGGDEKEVVDINRRLIATLRQKGAPVRSIEYSRQGHDAWNYAYRTPDLYQWMLGESGNPAEARHTSRRQDRKTVDPEYEIRWRRLPPDPQEPATWTAGNPPTEEEKLIINDDLYQFTSWRRDDADHPDPKTGRLHDFNYQLSMRLPDELNVAGEWMSWDGNGSIEPVRERDMSVNPNYLATLTTELAPRWRIDELHVAAAALAIGALDIPPISADINEMVVMDAAGLCGSEPCGIHHQMLSPGTQRQFWIDDQGLIRRFVGSPLQIDDTAEFISKSPLPLMFGPTTIVIEYDDAGRPTEWSVSVGEGEHGPTRWFSRAEVTQVDMDNSVRRLTTAP